jgi:hypothetical protein
MDYFRGCASTGPNFGARQVQAEVSVAQQTLQSIRGLVDYWSRDSAKFYPWGFAMNGQTARLEATRQMMHGLGIKRVVETGTYRGTTAEWFGQFGVPVETVEANQRYYMFSKTRLARFDNIEVIKGSSVPFLQQRASSDIPHLFYLDAHWEEHLPLREELQLIIGRYPNSVVVVDDFKVNDDPGYAFDFYGSDKELTLEYVSASHLPKLWTFFPAVRSEQETGAKRGWVVFTSNNEMAGKLRSINLLREYAE